MMTVWTSLLLLSTLGSPMPGNETPTAHPSQLAHTTKSTYQQVIVLDEQGNMVTPTAAIVRNVAKR
jgi:hypothetical protein